MVFQCMPAFFTGLAICLGCGLNHHWMVLFSIFVFLFIADKKLLMLALVILSAGYAHLRMPHKHTETVHKTGIFYPISAKPKGLPFQTALIVKGTFDGMPCSISYPRFIKPHLDGAYLVSGTLKGHYFKPDKKTSWKKLPHTISFAGWRYRTKEKIRKYFRKHISDKLSSDFASAIITGDTDNRFLRFCFARLGLQHLLAISGFHFGIMALILGTILKKLLPTKTATLFLLALLGGYAFLLGDSPSVLRAYLMLFLYLFGALINRKTTALNAFGGALCLELLYDPNHMATLSFTLSYSATLGILLFYDPCKTYLERLFKERPIEEINTFPIIDRYGYLLGSIFRKGLAINLAIYLPLIPILFATVGSFSILSLLYNLFTPFLVSIAILLLLTPFHSLTNYYITWLLELIRFPPPTWMATLYIPFFPSFLAIFLITILFAARIKKLSIYLRRDLDEMALDQR